MNNQLLLIKIKQRLNKLTSFDYDDIEGWMLSEAFNKAQRNWVRRQAEGINQERTGLEQTTRRMDDLQLLITPWTSAFTDQGAYYESCGFPADYLDCIRVSAWGQNKCCPPRRLKVYLAAISDVGVLLADHYKRPSFEWGETFATIAGNKIQVYTNGSFEVVDPTLIYLRQPTDIQISGTVDPATNLTVTTDVSCEFPDDIAELLLSEAAAILAADLESPQAQRNNSDTDKNT